MNIIFKNVKIYNVQDELDVVVGQSFDMELLNDFPPNVEIYANNDEVLSMKDKKVTADTIGWSNILFMSFAGGYGVHKTIKINVVSATSANATELKGELSKPVPKK